MTDFEDIYSQYFADVYKYALSLCRNETMAEEITQETFFKALKSIGKFNGDCKIRVWLCQIVKNTYFSLCQKDKHITYESRMENEGECIEKKLINSETACEIVRDLLPLYYDDVCSSESSTSVEEHLLGCDTCKKYFDSMSDDFIQTNGEKTAEKAKSNILKGIKKKLLRKNVMISVISVICAITVLFGGFSFVFHYQTPIPYHNGLSSAKMGTNGLIDVSFNGDDYYCSYEWVMPIDKDGAKKYVAYIYYTDTIWTRNFSNLQNDKQYKYSINDTASFDFDDGNGPIEVKKDISAVYYLNYKDSKMSTEELQKIPSKAVLLWEK
ncbi:sigma factor [Clostridium sp.]